MGRTLASLALPLLAGLLTASPSSAQTVVAEYCTNFAANRAAGGPGRAYNVGAEGIYMAAYRDCMRTYQIMLPVSMLPPVGSLEVVAGVDAEAERIWWEEDWVGEDRQAYCAAKYRSYNPHTGMYLSYSGIWKPCH